MEERLIIKYLSGYATLEEEAQLFDWVEFSETNKKEFTHIKNVWAIAGMAYNEANADEQKSKYKSLINRIKEKESGKRGQKTIPLLLYLKTKRFWSTAATLFFTAGIGSLLTLFLGNNQKGVPQLSVTNGKQTKVELADGSLIWLNSGSSLQYPSDFKGNIREVTLNGEAYFDIAHNEKKPFIVHVSDLNVKVLGTSFNLSSYVDDDEVQLTLEKGSVSIVQPSTNDEIARLVPGNMAIYSKKNQTIKLKNVDTNLYSSWRNGQFKFKGMSFEEIAKRLGRQYKVQFVFKNENLKNTTYNGSFYNYEPLEAVLKVMKTNSPFAYTMERDTVYIK
jgi:transmembrane sensor